MLRTAPSVFFAAILFILPGCSKGVPREELGEVIFTMPQIAGDQPIKPGFERKQAATPAAGTQPTKETKPTDDTKQNAEPPLNGERRSGD